MHSKNVILIAIIIILFFISVDTIIAYDGADALTDVTSTITSEEGEDGHQLPPVYMVAPFILLLLMIATGPIFYHHFWEHNYPKVAIALGSVTVIYYLAVLSDYHSILHSLAEYLSFIALLGSLFVASGGILLRVNRKATPFVNVLFLLFGSVIANVIGTTGASMLLMSESGQIGNENSIRFDPHDV